VIKGLLLCSLFLYSHASGKVDPVALWTFINNPSPDGSGTVIFQPNIQNTENVANITISDLVSHSNTPASEWKIFNPSNGLCDSAMPLPYTYSDQTTMFCYVYDKSDSPVAEYTSSMTWNADAIDSAANDGVDGIIYILNYNNQECTSIPDLGSAGSIALPPSPTVTTSLNGLQIEFNVSAAYLRNNTFWLLDFFNFAANSDSGLGGGRTCASLTPSTFLNTGKIYEPPTWYDSGPRSDWNPGYGGSAINSNLQYTMVDYTPTGTPWTITSTDCGHVQYLASFPLSHLTQTSSGGCSYSGSSNTPAVTTTGSNIYTGTLYAHALRPRSLLDPTQGYYKISYPFPFTFELQTSVSTLVSTSQKWNFQVQASDVQISSSGMTFTIETNLQDPSQITALNILHNATVTDYPEKSVRDSDSFDPTITFNSVVNGCGVDPTQVCIISWTVTVPNIPLTDLGNDPTRYDAQYSGNYAFMWTTSPDYSSQEADLIMNVFAVTPNQNTSIPSDATVSFFTSKSNMQSTQNAVTQFSSGDQIWVKHELQLDSQDSQGFDFTLTSAYVCRSAVSTFTPSLATGGCSADIPGVMETATDTRFTLYDSNSLPSGILDTTTLVWNFALVPPTDTNWPNSTVSNGFGINALPLVSDGISHDWYFHLVSAISQANKRGERHVRTYERFYRVDKQRSNSATGLQSINVEASKNSVQYAAASSLSPFWKDLF